jgi:hypothetical protein
MAPHKKSSGRKPKKHNKKVSGKKGTEKLSGYNRFVREFAKKHHLHGPALMTKAGAAWRASGQHSGKKRSSKKKKHSGKKHSGKKH